MPGIPKVTLFFDTVSPYCWFALETSLKKFSSPTTKISYVPVHAASIMSMIGCKMPFYEKILREYVFSDAKALGPLHGVDVTVPDDAYDRLSNAGTVAAQTFLVAVGAEQPDLLVGATRRILRRLWGENKPVHSVSDLHEVAADVGIRPAVVDGLRDDRWIRRLQENNRLAVSQGCFDVPWFHAVDRSGSEAVFCGFDRLHLAADFANR